jgi:hypothetical protein
MENYLSLRLHANPLLQLVWLEVNIMKIKISLGLLAILASTFYLSGCCAQSSSSPANESLIQVPDLQDEPLNTSGAVGLADMQEKTLYENMTYGFKMVYPNGWTMQEAEPNNMGLVVGFLVPGEDMDNPMDYVTVQVENLPPEQEITLDEYTGSILDNLRSTYPDFQILSEGDMIMSGETAHVIAYSMTDQQTPYQIILAYVIRDDRAYIITYYALAEKYSNFENAAKEMINSFELD